MLTEHNQSVKWTGGNTVVVQLGDVLDRGDSEIGARFASLIAQAARHAVAGGGGGVGGCSQEGTLGGRACHHSNCCRSGCQCALQVMDIDLWASLGALSGHQCGGCPCAIARPWLSVLRPWLAEDCTWAGST